MNVRVFLLLLVSGLFMAVWSSDQAAEQRFLAERTRLRTTRHLAERSAPSPVTPLLKTGSPSRQISVPRPDTRSAGLPRGVYQAVSDTGETFRITIDGDEPADQQPRDLYIVDTPDGTRWYFVRTRQANVRG